MRTGTRPCILGRGRLLIPRTLAHPAVLSGLMLLDFKDEAKTLSLGLHPTLPAYSLLLSLLSILFSIPSISISFPLYLPSLSSMQPLFYFLICFSFLFLLFLFFPFLLPSPLFPSFISSFHFFCLSFCLSVFFLGAGREGTVTPSQRRPKILRF